MEDGKIKSYLRHLQSGLASEDDLDGEDSYDEFHEADEIIRVLQKENDDDVGDGK